VKNHFFKSGSTNLAKYRVRWTIEIFLAWSSEHLNLTERTINTPRYRSWSTHCKDWPVVNTMLSHLTLQRARYAYKTTFESWLGCPMNRVPLGMHLRVAVNYKRKVLLLECRPHITPRSRVDWRVIGKLCHLNREQITAEKAQNPGALQIWFG